ncbi:unnamed protein product [Linum trigynum]|uniref:Uncharacterized protein n=1 Tax=Linum trigynum TaxID=586398 RepID=A0AAV2CFV3_9ROSI
MVRLRRHRRSRRRKSRRSQGPADDKTGAVQGWLAATGWCVWSGRGEERLAEVMLRDDCCCWVRVWRRCLRWLLGGDCTQIGD